MAVTNYTDIALEQKPFANLPGGGMTGQGVPATAGFNDPALEIGDVKEVIATYTMLGNEAANDLVNIYLAQPGTILDPAFSSVSGNGAATTATISVGDDDTTGTTGANAGAADQARYATNLNVATNMQTSTGAPLAFVGANSLTAPYAIGATAQETGSQGGTIAGSWVQAKWITMATPVAGKVLVFRLKLVRP